MENNVATSDAVTHTLRITDIPQDYFHRVANLGCKVLQVAPTSPARVTQQSPHPRASMHQASTR